MISHVDGVPTFSPGEEAYLFLWKRDGQPYRVLGWTQGTFRIARDPKNGMQRVTQDSAGGAVFDPGSRTFRNDGIRGMGVLEFEQRLRRALGASAAEE